MDPFCLPIDLKSRFLSVGADASHPVDTANNHFRCHAEEESMLYHSYNESLQIRNREHRHRHR
jgi:hypothetical protein